MATLLLTCPSPTGASPETRRNGPALGNPRSISAVRFLSHPSKSSGRSLSLPSISATTPSFPESASVTTTGAFLNSLERVEVFDLNGKSVPIIDLWRDRKSVVAFARHFGCVLCRKRADLLASKKELMDAAGVVLILIAPGSVDQAKAFFEQTKFKGEVYADPNHSSFDALDFSYGISTTFTPLAGIKIAQSYIEGYRQDWGLSFRRDTMSRGGCKQVSSLLI